MASTGPESLPRADLVIHPDFYEAEGYEVSPSVQAYYDAISDQIVQAELPILIYMRGQRTRRPEFWDTFKRGRRFLSCVDGMIAARRVQPFNDLLAAHGVAEARVHGAFLGACVMNVMKGLHTDSDTGILYFTYDDNCSGSIEPTVTVGHVLDAGHGAFSQEREQGLHPLTSESQVHDCWQTNDVVS
jgi:hypothetical protein